VTEGRAQGECKSRRKKKGEQAQVVRRRGLLHVNHVRSQQEWHCLPG
jgi:hypothetical protein